MAKIKDATEDFKKKTPVHGHLPDREAKEKAKLAHGSDDVGIDADEVCCGHPDTSSFSHWCGLKYLFSRLTRTQRSKRNPEPRSGSRIW